MTKIFRPDQKAGGASSEPSVFERRKHSRHRYMCGIEIILDDGNSYLTVYRATTFEISEGGLSAATPNFLPLGLNVELSPVLGHKVKAIVRRKIGAMYGFEFVDLTDQQQLQIRDLCKGLPLFQTVSEI
jgi:PilZ domain